MGNRWKTGGNKIMTREGSSSTGNTDQDQDSRHKGITHDRTKT